MADLKDKLKKFVDKALKKKPKEVKLEQEPEGTKAKPLDAKTREAMEEILGADLKKVRIHTGGNAAEVAGSLGAKAFAQGANIYFAKPSDATNQELLAHELTHVIQQGGGTRPATPKKGRASVSK